MALLRAEAEKLSNNQMLSGVIEEIIDRDDMFAILPFVQVNAKAYVYHREDVGAQNNITLGSGLPAFVDPVSDTITEGAVPFIEVIAKLRVLAGDVDVDNFLAETMDDSNNQLAIQLTKKAKAVARLYHKTVAQGNATNNAKEFDGLSQMVTAAQTISAGTNGATLTLSMLDQLLDQVPNGADVLVMRRGTIRAYRQLMRAAGGTSAAEYMVEAFGRPMLTHNGVPIVVNDFISPTETQGTLVGAATSVYAARFNEADGVHGLWGGANAGIRVEEVGTVQNKDSKRYRLKWYCGMALKSTQSLARLQGLTNV